MIKAIQYSLQKNNLETGGESYFARVKRNLNIQEEDLIDMMAAKFTTVSRHDIKAVLSLMSELVKEQLLLGNTVSTGIFHAGVTIKGIFDHYKEELGTEKHSYHVNMRPAKILSAAIQADAKAVRLAASKPEPQIEELIDFSNNNVNSTATAGASAQINGRNLRYDISDPLQGIFFKNSADNEEYRVDMVNALSPAKIIFLVPPGLSAGDYQIISRAAFGTEIREKSFKHSITVAA